MRDFMNGRYGNDQLNRFLSIIALILIIISFFFRNSYLDIIALVLLVLTYIRMLSRNIPQRSAENEKFLDLTARFRPGGYGGGRNRSGYSRGGYGNGSYNNSHSQWNNHSARDKNYRYFSCPHCSQKVRVPKGKGKIAITCPRCRTEFIKRS